LSYSIRLGIWVARAIQAKLSPDDRNALHSLFEDNASVNLAPRQLAKQAITTTGLVRLMASATEPSVAILRYHALHEDPACNEHTIGRGITHSRACFESQMEILASKFHLISLDELLASLQQGRPIPRWSVAVTFDDGYADNFEIAAPILNRYGIPACFYILVGSIDAHGVPWFVRIRHAMARTKVPRWTDPAGQINELDTPEHREQAFWSASRVLAKSTGVNQETLLREIECQLDVEPLGPSDCRMLTWDQVRALHNMGHMIGSHTISHANSAYISATELDTEFCASKKRLEQELSSPVIHFSYPSPILEPHFSSESIERSRSAGYCTAVTCTPGVVRLGDDPLSLRRVLAQDDPLQFQWALENSFINRIV
jgi:peptidoglycan/xylan/chitin deacetylase (PgdA/CDA1 family)